MQIFFAPRVFTANERLLGSVSFIRIFISRKRKDVRPKKKMAEKEKGKENEGGRERERTNEREIDFMPTEESRGAQARIFEATTASLAPLGRCDIRRGGNSRDTNLILIGWPRRLMSRSARGFDPTLGNRTRERRSN